MDLTPDLGRLRYPIVFLGAVLLSIYFTPLIRRGAIRYGVVDRPDGVLKTHREPVAYLGGIAIYLAFLFALAFTYEFTRQVTGLLLAGSMVVMLGLFDDLKVLSPGVKLVGQIVAAAVLMKSGIMIQLAFLPEWLAAVLTLLWLVGMTNALNIIDVSDGLAAGIAVIGGMFLYVICLWNNATTIAMLTLALVGATLGFLAFNRPPASIYLGDAGSMFLGFMLGALAMRGEYTIIAGHEVAAITPAVILGVPIFDTIFVTGARLARGIPVMRGSPDHFAVRLRTHGVSAGMIALITYISAALLGVAALLICTMGRWISVGIGVGLAVMAGIVILGLWRLGRGGERESGGRAKRKMATEQDA